MTIMQPNGFGSFAFVIDIGAEIRGEKMLS